MILHAVWCAGPYGIAKIQKQRGGTIYLNLYNYVPKFSGVDGAAHTQNRMFMTGNVQIAVQGEVDGNKNLISQKVHVKDILMSYHYMKWVLAFAYTGDPNGSFTPALPGFDLFASPTALTLQQFDTASPGWNMIGSNGTPLASDSPVACTYNTTWYADAML